MKHQMRGATQAQPMFFFPFVWCGWQWFHKRFNMSGNDPIKFLALMVKRFLKTVKILKT